VRVLYVTLKFPFGIGGIPAGVPNRVNPSIRRVPSQITHSVNVPLHFFYNPLVNV
jgi:hypothetical protein